MNLKFGKKEKINIVLIVISAVSLILSYTLNIHQLSWISVLLCGTPILKECIEGLITEYDIKADLLVSIAIISSIIIGEIFAAGEIATIMAIGGFLEEYTVKKTQSQIEELIQLTPKKATRIKNGKEEKVDVCDIKIGDILKVVPGETIVCDGIVVNGETSINQSTLTGESLPVDKIKGDDVYSGTINQYGSFIMKVNKTSKDSSLQKLIELVESSSPENAKIVKTADKWATWIVIIAFTLAILTYIFTGEIIRAVTILVVFCPCALVLATPTAIMASIGNLTKHGILVKNGQSIEELASVDELIFDKTGTLTYGKPEVIFIESNDSDMMKLLASLESKSEHPIAKAIVNYHDSDDYYEVTDFKMLIGNGVCGLVNGHEIVAGNAKLLKSKNIEIINENSCKNGEIEIYVAKDNKYIGKLLLTDVLRKESISTNNELNKLGINTTLMTGDNEKTGSFIARKVKVSNAHYNCMPEDKSNYISTLQKDGKKVAMIGDGVNDAPSLKKSNVGIAMGDIGSDITIDAADITLINDNIHDLTHLFKLSKKTLKTINLNIGFSLTINIIAMLLAVLGILGPIGGALVHNLGSVFVIIYSSLLLNLG